MDKGMASPGGQVRNPAEWRAIVDLFEARQYEQLEELLREVQGISERQGDPIRAQILDAARQICLACGQSRAEIAWHQQASEEAERRENNLRQQLRKILDLINDPQSAVQKDVSEVPTSPLLIAADLPRFGIWQRFRGLLGMKPALRRARSAAPVTASGKTTQPSLAVYCLGPFRVLQDGQTVEDWPSSKGKSIFKYLVTHRIYPVPKEVLMDLFWPEAQQDAARNNLNVSIYGLRQALRKLRPDYTHVLFQDECYLLNPDLHVWVDADEFIERVRTGQFLEKRRELVMALREYRAAESLYQGDFLEEDRYEDWLVSHRQSLREDCLKLLDRLSSIYLDLKDYDSCVSVCQKMLTIDQCLEQAHRRLMRCYCRQGQPYLALRQYHLCGEKLKQELDVLPSKSTEVLYQRIRKGGRL